MLKKKKIRIGILQVKNRIEHKEGSFLEAETLLDNLKNQNLDIVFLPELSPRGYAANKQVWEKDKALSWAQKIAIKYQVYLGFGFLEYVKNHTYNSYGIVNQEGKLLGVVRKERAENYVFKASKSPKYIDTPLGRIGIAICADSHHISVLKQLIKAKVTMVVLPHAWPVATKESNIISQIDIEKGLNLLDQFPFIYAQTLKVPTVYVNTVGSTSNMIGLLGKIMSPEHFSFQGKSKIISQEGTLLASLDHKESSTFSDVLLQEKGFQVNLPKVYSKGWLHEGSAMLRRVIMPLDKLCGHLYYFLKQKERKQKTKGSEI